MISITILVCAGTITSRRNPRSIEISSIPRMWNFAVDTLRATLEDSGYFRCYPDGCAGRIDQQIARLYLRPIAVDGPQKLSSEKPVTKVVEIIFLPIINVPFPLTL